MKHQDILGIKSISMKVSQKKKKKKLHITIIQTDVRFVEDVNKTANY